MVEKIMGTLEFIYRQVMFEMSINRWEGRKCGSKCWIDEVVASVKSSSDC